MLDSEGYAQMRAAFVEYERISGLEVAASVAAAMDSDDDTNLEYWNAVISFGNTQFTTDCSFAWQTHKRELLL